MNKKNKTKKIKDDRVNNISWIELVVKYTQKKSGTNAHTKEPRGRRCQNKPGKIIPTTGLHVDCGLYDI